ncbi:hypothetical protein AM571_PB00319 (plasmid) [Rhizobium etli 8C-3]|uniref:Uncharacterized protein n=1 Tax=Rhizobium etli 8C-3 TaxID=538025 RepID=A0A1L5PBT1_RHIET|nr:hypothetical protein AM571_PB00319 [Rhizobium etli 8C-3]
MPSGKEGQEFDQPACCIPASSNIGDLESAPTPERLPAYLRLSFSVEALVAAAPKSQRFGENEWEATTASRFVACAT